MKTSVKISAAVAVFFSFVSLHSIAQTTSKTETYASGISLSIGADAGIPVGSLKDNYNWNLRGSIQGDFPIIKD
jgi:hypothetical protein